MSGCGCIFWIVVAIVIIASWGTPLSWILIGFTIAVILTGLGE